MFICNHFRSHTSIEPPERTGHNSFFCFLPSLSHSSLPITHFTNNHQLLKVLWMRFPRLHSHISPTYISSLLFFLWYSLFKTKMKKKYKKVLYIFFSVSHSHSHFIKHWTFVSSVPMSFELRVSVWSSSFFLNLILCVSWILTRSLLKKLSE